MSQTSTSNMFRLPGISNSLIQGSPFFVFVLAQDITPVLLQTKYSPQYPFAKYPPGPWQEKVLLKRTIIPRFKYLVKVDNAVVPQKLRDKEGPLLVYSKKIQGKQNLVIVDPEKYLKNIAVILENGAKTQTQKLDFKDGGVLLENLLPGPYSLKSTNTIYQDSIIPHYSISQPGPIHRQGEYILVYHSAVLSSEMYLQCQKCKALLPPYSKQKYFKYKSINYLPFKELIDWENVSWELLVSYVASIGFSLQHKQGFEHLLNMLRTATYEDELTLMTNLYNDDPEFAAAVENKLFTKDFLPLMWDLDLQKIFNKLDTALLALFLSDASVLVKSKVYKNISQRRKKILQQEISYLGAIDRATIKDNAQYVLSYIRLYFEKKVGRILKVQPQSPPVFQVQRNLQDDYYRFACLGHQGPFSLVQGDNGQKYNTSSLAIHIPQNKCLSYKANYIYNPKHLVQVKGVDENYLYLHFLEPLYLVTIYLMDWFHQSENGHEYENLALDSLIYLPYSGHSLTLHIGAFTAKDEVRQEVVRLLIGK